MGGVFSSVKYTRDGTPYYTLNDIKKLHKLDEGGCGNVMKGYDTVVKGLSKKKRAVAVKIFSTQDKYSEREIEVLKKHSHPNIVELYGVIWNGTPGQYTGYVMEYMELGSLHNEIHDPFKIYDLKMIVKWIHQIGEGLEYIHRNGIIHRDVKPKNILLAARDHLKLADFGLARIIVSGNTCTSGYVGTDIYRAPEVLTSNDYGAPADVYSFGVTILEMVYRRNSWDYIKIDADGYISVELPTQLDSKLEELVKKCLHKSVSNRPKISEFRNFIPACFETILIIGEHKNAAILSEDRTSWIELQLESPSRSFDSGGVYLNKEIYIFGGDQEPRALYKLDKNLKWIRRADMYIGRKLITNSCLEWNGSIWVFGGEDVKYKTLNSVERYDQKTNKWMKMPDMIHPRTSSAVALWNDGIVISGGYVNAEINHSVEYFNPEDGIWKELPHLPTSLVSHSLVSYQEKLIIMGGCDPYGCSSQVWALDSSNSQWKQLPSMTYASRSFAGIVYDQKIYAIGGMDNDLKAMNRVEIFDGDHWRDGPRLPYGWDHMSAMIISKDFADHLCKFVRKEGIQ